MRYAFTGLPAVLLDDNVALTQYALDRGNTAHPSSSRSIVYEGMKLACNLLIPPLSQVAVPQWRRVASAFRLVIV